MAFVITVNHQNVSDLKIKCYISKFQIKCYINKFQIECYISKSKINVTLVNSKLRVILANSKLCVISKFKIMCYISNNFFLIVVIIIQLLSVFNVYIHFLRFKHALMGTQQLSGLSVRDDELVVCLFFMLISTEGSSMLSWAHTN